MPPLKDQERAAASPALPQTPLERNSQRLGRYNDLLFQTRGRLGADFSEPLNLPLIAAQTRLSEDTVRQSQQNADAAKRALRRVFEPVVQSAVSQAGARADEVKELIQANLGESLETYRSTEQDPTFFSFARDRITAAIEQNAPTLRETVMLGLGEIDQTLNENVIETPPNNNGTVVVETPKNVNRKTKKGTRDSKKTSTARKKTRVEASVKTDAEQEDDDGEEIQTTTGTATTEIPETSPDAELIDLIKDVMKTDKVLGVDTNGERHEIEAPIPEEMDTSPTIDTLGLYFKEIHNVSLLTGPQEVELAQAVEKGNAAKGLLEQISDPANQDDLNSDVRAGEAARDRLIVSNLGLVTKVAQRYMGRGLPLADLIQDGNIGLMRVVDKFDHRRGFRFSTYAYWQIRQAVTRALSDTSRVKRIPVNRLDTVRAMTKLEGRMTQDFEREPTTSELALELEKTPEWVADRWASVQQPVSWETPIGQDGEDSVLGDFVPDKGENYSPLVEDVRKNELREKILEILDETFSGQPVGPEKPRGRERRILELRFGLHGPELTLEEIGREFGITRERARQIEAKAIEKLRHPDILRILKDYLA